jgi:hypothetical protein
MKKAALNGAAFSFIHNLLMVNIQVSSAWLGL